MPDLPELADATSVLKSIMDNPSSQPSLETQLVYCIKGARHESMDVRSHAVSRLHKLLKDRRVRLIKDPVLLQSKVLFGRLWIQILPDCVMVLFRFFVYNL